MRRSLNIYRNILLLIVFAAFVSCAGAGMKKEDTAMKHDHGMAMHHQHLMLNHSLGMALQGSNLVMLGQMGMAKGIDDVSVSHGKHMMKNAEALFNDVMSGESMMDMHGKGASPDKDPAMAYTHKLAEAQLKVINLLKMMPGVM